MRTDDTLGACIHTNQPSCVVKKASPFEFAKTFVVAFEHATGSSDHESTSSLERNLGQFEQFQCRVIQ